VSACVRLAVSAAVGGFLNVITANMPRHAHQQIRTDQARGSVQTALGAALCLFLSGLFR
jgi:hypothetical protein